MLLQFIYYYFCNKKFHSYNVNPCTHSVKQMLHFEETADHFENRYSISPHYLKGLHVAIGSYSQPLPLAGHRLPQHFSF